MKDLPRPRRTSAGFTLVEILVVVGIMMIMTAVALPAIGRYFRNYRMRNAVQAVGGEISAARNKAIMKNVNWGVVFVIQSDPQGRANRYQYMIEDDQTPPRSSIRMAATSILPPGSDPLKLAQVGPLRELPDGIVFGTACTGTPAFAPTDKGFRFTRMGAWCKPNSTDAACPAFAPPTPPASPANLVMNTAGEGARICLVQADTGLRREVRVGAGGRVLAEDTQR